MTTAALVMEETPAGSWDLVTATKAGDMGAFSELYVRYAPDVYGFILRRVRDHHTAEDLTSETFLRALRRIDSVTYQGSDIGAWFVTIARNLILDHAKSSRYRCEVPVACPDPGADRGRNPEDEVMARAEVVDLRDSLQRCIARLPESQQEVVHFRFFAGLSTAETAAVTGRSEAAVKSLRNRAVWGLTRLLPLDEQGTGAAA